MILNLISELQQTKKEILNELKMTRTTVTKLLAQRKKFRTSAFNLRFIIKNKKQEILKMKTDFVEEKIILKNKIHFLKTKIKNLKCSMGLLFIDDDEYHVDGKTGVIDLTEPKTPPKPKRVRTKQSKMVSKIKRSPKKLTI